MDFYGTIGPACADVKLLQQMVEAGMTGIRMNLSHGPLAAHADWLALLRKAGVKKLLIDLQGPELRIGRLPQPLSLTAGQTVRLGAQGIPCPSALVQGVQPGQELLLDDGKLLARVDTAEPEALVCTVVRGGVLQSRKSLAAPGADIQMPTLTVEDKENLAIAAGCGVTGVMLPFVRGAADICNLRQALAEAGAPQLKILAKIENLAGVQALPEFLPLVDEVVIARGDLGNAMPLWELPRCQKQLASCEAERKKAVETAQTSADAANAFFAKYPLLEALARERWATLSGPDKAKPDRAVAQAAEKAQTKLDEALQLYLTGTLEPAQKAYNERYVCDYPLGLAGIEQYRAQHESLVRIDLERYAARLDQAQRDCKDRFRKDILFRMKDDIFNARRQFRELNKVMEQLTYGEEVYRFELEPSRDPQLAAFYQVIVDKGNQQMTDGDSLDNLAATADPVYERQVDELMEKIMADVDENTRARQEGRSTSGATLSDYVDYRTYLDYDIKVTNTVSGQQAYLSRVSRDSSGGENQAPFYVAICASLLQIYQKSENSIRLVLLDEAFSKMTSDRIRPMMELFRRLQLQVLLISTVEKSTAIQPYCDITYSIVRHGDANAIAPFYRLTAPQPAPEKETEP